MKTVRLFSLLIGLAVSALAIAGSGQARAQNLINNPGFESSLEGWQNWGNATTVTGYDVQDSVQSLRVGRSSGGVGQDVFSKLGAGGSYRMSGWAKRDSGLYGHTFGIEIKDSSGRRLLHRWATADSTGWKRYEFTFTMPSGASVAWVNVWKNDGTGYGYADGLELVRTDTPPGSSSALPPAGGYPDIELLAPTAALPTVESCLSLVRRSTWEPRPQNGDENANTTPLLVPKIDGINSGAQTFYLNRIAAVNAANITGTTDELIQFFSCYWGVDDESTRARALLESSWDQDVNGDQNCNGQGVSWGLLQVKNKTPRGCTPPVHTGTYPDAFVSTGANLNYALAWLVGCYRGDMSGWIPGDLMADPPRRMRECIGLWFSGSWRAGNADYLARYDEALRTKPWLSSAFPNWTIGQVCRTAACDTLPADR